VAWWAFVKYVLERHSYEKIFDFADIDIDIPLGFLWVSKSGPAKELPGENEHPGDSSEIFPRGN
jgi:hypothetical protein